jgi:hypothetical protein
VVPPDAGVVPADAAVDAPAADLGAADAPAPASDAASLVLTVNELPDYLSGARPYRQRDGVPHDFRVRVNRANFTLDLMAGGPLDWATVKVTCDQPFTLAGMVIAPGQRLPASAFLPTETPEHVRLRVTEPALPEGAVTCQASAAGRTSGAISFQAATLPAALDPFLRPEVWLVLLSRDIFRLEVAPLPDGTRRLSSVHVPEGNGELDFDEPMFELGLFSRQAPEATRTVKARLLAEVRRKAHRLFGLHDDGTPDADSVDIKLWFEGDPGAPTAADYAAGDFSMIALGGDGTPEDQAQNLVGRADVDWNNRTRNDDSGYGRGVYPTGIVRQALANPVSLLLLGSILPGRGTPIGEGPGDARLLAPDFDPDQASPDLQARHRVLTLVMRLLSTALASTLCHEIGHSLGLVPSGPPPLGMFAEMPGLDFTVMDSSGPHIDTPGLNVEQSGANTNWMEALNSEPRFNELSLAYLRRRLVVGAP